MRDEYILVVCEGKGEGRGEGRMMKGGGMVGGCSRGNKVRLTYVDSLVQTIIMSHSLAPGTTAHSQQFSAQKPFALMMPPRVPPGEISVICARSIFAALAHHSTTQEWWPALSTVI